MMRDLQRRSLKISLALHGTVLFLFVAIPALLRACERRRPPPKLMFVEFTVSVPPPPAPEAPTPPPPPPKEEIPIPEKKPPPKPPEPPKPPPKDIRQTNRVVRPAPPPKDKPLTEKEIAELLKRGARIGDTTQIPPASQMALAAYYNHVRERMYAAWQQPAQLASLPGLSTDVRITVAPNGSILSRVKTRSSGNALMDDSVMKAVQSVKALRALPAGYRQPVEIDITFELGD